MKLQLSLAVVGGLLIPEPPAELDAAARERFVIDATKGLSRFGPHSILTEEAVRSLAEKLSLPGDHVVPVESASGLSVGALDPASVRVVETSPGHYAVRADVEIEEPARREPALLARSDELSAAAEESGQ